MDALVVRLAQLDVDAAGALRVVMFYDTLMRRRVDLPALARASAALAECVAGIRLHGTGRVIRFGPDGRSAQTPPPAAAGTPVTLDDEEIGTVWLERTGASRALDEMLLDRFALAVATVVERYGPARTTMADPALVELVIGADSDEAARARALRLLGFAADLPVRVAAVRSPQPLDRIGGSVCPGRPVKAATVGGVGVLLATTLDATGFPPDTLAGLGTAAELGRAWREARTALRFATARRPVVDFGDLGSLALLAQVPRDALRDNADVAAVAAIAADRDALDTLDAYCASGSVRRAADLLHLHHSSVARRVEALGRGLGIDLTEPTGLLRARLALAAWRLLAD
ncbi:helix-turn-helix domain-containing protein [Nocardia farcinica]|uniref:helix-turn-helix domain-containing protein n=1 Tax=Nocardia farcinica TaxID=37329 RepID=UPI001894EDA5|nr:helix-turn-helix domain-containing protein [Nocardia farcinica]MBF6376187.1 helix-turn-helix domain-containing protein [Nocardia farcinica]